MLRWGRCGGYKRHSSNHLQLELYCLFVHLDQCSYSISIDSWFAWPCCRGLWAMLKATRCPFHPFMCMQTYFQLSTQPVKTHTQKTLPPVTEKWRHTHTHRHTLDAQPHHPFPAFLMAEWPPHPISVSFTFYYQSFTWEYQWVLNTIFVM